MTQLLSDTHEPSPEALRWVAACVGRGAAVESVVRLAGATSSVLHGIGVSHSGRNVGLVLRRFVNAEWLAEEPDLAIHEAANLRKAAGAGVPTPELIASDEEGLYCGVPSTLMTRLPGCVELQPANPGAWLRGLAEAIISVHAVEAGTHTWTYRPYSDLSKLEAPVWSEHPALWERAIEVVSGPRPAGRECFIHRDYHPANVLWRGGAVSGVVDWTSACRGAAGFDVAWCRLNLAQLCGVEAADAFLRAYQTLAGASFEYHPFWDLIAAIEILPGPPGVYEGWAAFATLHLNDEMMRERLDEYVASVVARL